jgi:nitronate monooxygenase
MRTLGIRHPVIQAPMAGGTTTPALVAAVSEAGGLGSLGAAYMTPAAIRDAIVEVRARTEKPFAVNLFIPADYEVDPNRIERSRQLLEPYRRELGVAEPSLPEDLQTTRYREDFDEQLAVVIREQAPVFSFTFGSLPKATVARLKERGVTVIGTATTVEEGEYLEGAGVDAVVAQGAEAGAHRGTFLGSFESSMVGTMALVPQLVDALGIPVIASGGIMDGRGLAAALCLGAQAVQMGTAFLTCEESGAPAVHKAAVLAATGDDTAITRAFSGRPARGLRNRFLLEVAEHEADLPAFPVQNALTRDVRAAAGKQGRPEFMSLWAGQAARLARRATSTTAAGLVREVTEGAGAVLASLVGVVADAEPPGARKTEDQEE